jgi:PAS domain S-box-containing protein
MNEIKNSEIQIGDSFLESFNEHRLKTEFEELLKKSFNGKRFKVNQKMFSNGRTNSIFENTFIPVLDHSKTAIGVIIISKQKLLNQNGSDSKKNNLPPAVVKQVNSKNPFNVDAELFNYTLNSLTQGVVITDKEGVIVWANKAVKNITGYEISELIGQTPGIFKSEVHNSSFYENLWQTIQNGKTWKGEIVNRKKDDSFYFEEMVITPVINENSEVTHYIAFKQDITEKRQKEKEQQKDAASISIIVDKVPAVLWMVDADLMFVSSQGSGLQQMDLKPNQIVGMTVYEFFGTKDREHPPIKAHLQALKGISEQFMLKWKDEIFEAQVEPLKNEDNKIVGCVGIAHNVTDRLKYEKALIESREKAEQSNKLKSEFLAQMSHEIRTPLNVMISAANLLEEENEDMDEDVSLSFQLINSSGSRIIRTIDLLLNMSELHTGTYDFIQEKFDLKTDVLEQVFENYLSKAEAKGLSLQFSCETDETTISGDRYSVLEIFSNLVDNAIKYTENGKVEIIIDKDESKNLAVFVVDTGIGISKEYLPHLFEKFSQEDEGYTRKYEGNGLGLALVREYCTLNNAVLEVESEKGKGSIFKVLFH